MTDRKVSNYMIIEFKKDIKNKKQVFIGKDGKKYESIHDYYKGRKIEDDGEENS